MARALRWDPCIAHHGQEVDTFVHDYFGCADRNVLFLAGAGFDPRSTAVASRLVSAGAAIKAVLIREVRPNPGVELVQRATANAHRLMAAFAEHEIVTVNIFASDNAVVGGRNAVAALHRESFVGVTDIVVDVSALSIGISFSLIRYIVERIERGGGGGGSVNLHLFVAHDPDVDQAIRPVAGDSPGFVHGFRGGSTLDRAAAAARLWLPQLAQGRRAALVRLHDFVTPHDTCPVLPFPARNPRLGDELAEHFLTQLEAWSVDTRNVVYAAEDDPLDLYRTILRLDDLRRPVFAEVGGSLLVLSPVGSKIMALGSLMAALERDLPVAYIEAIGYDVDLSVTATNSQPHLVHIWLEGEAYPALRPALQREATSAR